MEIGHVYDLANPPDVDHVAEILEDEIVLGRLHPRQRLIEEELCKRFCIKRHAARLVLTQLERQGLVEIKRNLGAVVRAYTVKEVMDLWAVRELLEQQCLSLIPLPVDSGRLDALRETQRLHDAAADAGDLRAVFRINVEFHRQIFEMSDNSFLIEATLAQAQRAQIIRAYKFSNPAALDQSRRDHWDMIRALENGDRESLMSVGHRHLLPGRDAFRDFHRYE